MKPNQYPVQPEHIWNHFYDITQIPRPSGKEEAIREHIASLAKTRGYEYKTDSVGNIVVYVPATKGYEHAPIVAIQNHLDMVTVKTGDKAHDFEKDPLTLMVENGWLKADRTTLGSDNGIGVAAALAAMTDDTVIHPALELLFTTEEETGLHGASGLDASLLSATRMLNLDTEDWGEIYIGCAGGYGYEAQRQLIPKVPKPGLKAWQIHLKGLQGGHSGVQIHEQLGNANKLLVEALSEAVDLDWQLVSFRGGVAHNVIAREASAVVMIDEAQLEQWNLLLETAKQRWLGFLPAAEKALDWAFNAVEVDQPIVLSEADKGSFLSFISIMPHGAQSYSLKQPADLVDLSCNLATVNISEGSFKIQTSMRFFNKKQALGLKQQFENIFNTFHMAFEIILDYPGWNPDFNSELLARTKRVAEEVTGSNVELKAIHAGLECGILLSKKPDMDVVSFGPTIRGAHSPTERLEIATVTPFWALVKALLADLAVS